MAAMYIPIVSRFFNFMSLPGETTFESARNILARERRSDESFPVGIWDEVGGTLHVNDELDALDTSSKIRASLKYRPTQVKALIIP